MQPLLTTAAVIALLLAFGWEGKLLPYALFLLFACFVMWGAGIPFARRKSWGLGTLLAAPIILISLSMMFGRFTQPMIEALGGTFDSHFAGFFFGIARTTEELAAAGYAERQQSIKGYAVLAFIVSMLSAWKFLCEVATLENMNVDKILLNRAQPLPGVYVPILILLFMFLGSLMGVDVYSPSCTTRCSGIQRGNFPFFQMFTLWLSLTYIFVGFFVAVTVSKLAPLPAIQSKRPLDAETT